ncbi:MAG TPA: ABC transporter substrate-binding protein [Casimicrobiaceae bacterium]|jgi:putative ABC transport system substrate-binding protein|nr:ABC transporter substrate-binding protein [Casimicrobiaceae bacterium]
MERRRFIGFAAAILLARPLRAGAQSTARAHRIGFLGNSTAALEANLVGPFRDGLRELGYVEGRNLAIEYRWAEGNYKRFPKLVDELLAAGVEIIVTAGTPAAQAVERATKTVPLVMVAVGDPVGTQLVASLAHPGGNATGLTSIAPDLEGKRLELLTQVAPRLSTVAVLWNPDNAFHAGAERQAHEAAHVLHLDLVSVQVRSARDFDAAFDAIVSRGAGAMSILADRVFLHNRARIVEFATKRRLPAVYPYRELVDAGGLMSFGPDYADMHRRAAAYVDRILKGAKPADLPIEQPARFELVINQRAARAIGVAFPSALLLRASDVLE